MLREPASTREKMSRPFVSVPRGCDQVGGSLVGNWLSKIGLYGATRPGKIAQKSQKPMTIAPMNTGGERMSSRKRSARAVRASLRAAGGGAGEATALNPSSR